MQAPSSRAESSAAPRFPVRPSWRQPLEEVLRDPTTSATSPPRPPTLHTGGRTLAAHSARVRGSREHVRRQPLVGQQRRVPVAVISVCGPRERFAEVRDRAVKLMLDAAGDLSRQMGGGRQLAKEPLAAAEDVGRPPYSDGTSVNPRRSDIRHEDFRRSICNVTAGYVRDGFRDFELGKGQAVRIPSTRMSRRHC